MKTRQQRLNELYEYLRHTGHVHTQEDFANLIGAKRPGISAALNGNSLYLTDNLFKKICNAFPQTFNLQYLLTGEGQLTYNIEADLGTSSTNYTKSEKDIISLATDLIVELEAMRRQTKDELALLVQARQSFESATADLRNLITTLSNPHNETLTHPIDYFPSLAAEDIETPQKTQK